MTVAELNKLIRSRRGSEYRAVATDISHRLEHFSGGSDIEFADGVSAETLLDAPIVMTMRDDERLVIARG